MNDIPKDKDGGQPAPGLDLSPQVLAAAEDAAKTARKAVEDAKAAAQIAALAAKAAEGSAAAAELSMQKAAGSEKPLQVDEYKKKSFELMIDSLKIYITLDTFAFGGLLAIFNATKNPAMPEMVYTGLTFFLISACLSLYVINSFINVVNKGSMDIRNGLLQDLNMGAIVFFVYGLISGALFIVHQPHPANGASSTIIIENGLIKVTGSMSSGVKIQIDSLKRTKTFILDVK